MLIAAVGPGVVVYPWNFHPELIHNARRPACTAPVQGLAGPRTRGGAGGRPRRRDRGQRPPARAAAASGLDWPGRSEGLTEREAEIFALITQGKNNADVAARPF